MADREERSWEGPPVWEALVLKDEKHSGLGIASFAVWLFAALGFITAFVLAVAEDEFGPHFEGLALYALFAGTFIAVVGLVLGLLGLGQRGRQKVFVIVGLAFNGLTLLLGGLIFVIRTAVN